MGIIEINSFKTVVNESIPIMETDLGEKDVNYVAGETKIAVFKLLVRMNENMNKLTEAMQIGDLESCNKWNEKNLQANQELHKLLQQKKEEIA
ncbi:MULTISPECIES: hypothetical protein [Bacillus cereus group]|uniref:hypothetical protein n=1 Tax=Bacillus cereus group TaxID=86661 RepID=UPI00119FFFDB|nr:hypothetical protein [Bacillus sp. FDAARGOS_235]HDR7367931.1 hypothetical protein [Bacillus toyonensis]